MSVLSRIRPPAQATSPRRSWLLGGDKPRSALLTSLPAIAALVFLLVGLGLLASALSDSNSPPVVHADTLPIAANRTLIDINTATIAELVTLPVVGERRARAVVELREQRPFDSLADLVQRGVLKPNELPALADLIAAYVPAD
ncbi:MAG: helix-hairpin-helix domain-containing protein [Chloroflexi bacterium]|nr:helix-hairpin-helix domain-containing protein [Chloroflexota bacterium]